MKKTIKLLTANKIMKNPYQTTLQIGLILSLCLVSACATDPKGGQAADAPLGFKGIMLLAVAQGSMQGIAEGSSFDRNKTKELLDSVEDVFKKSLRERPGALSRGEEQTLLERVNAEKEKALKVYDERKSKVTEQTVSSKEDSNHPKPTAANPTNQTLLAQNSTPPILVPEPTRPALREVGVGTDGSYKHFPDVKETPPSRNIVLTRLAEDEGGQRIAFDTGGEAGTVKKPGKEKPEMVIDGLGSANIQIQIVQTNRPVTYAGLVFTENCVLSLKEDGTLLVDKENITAKDRNDNQWKSGKATVGNPELIAFFPDDFPYKWRTKTTRGIVLDIPGSKGISISPGLRYAGLMFDKMATFEILSDRTLVTDKGGLAGVDIDGNAWESRKVTIESQEVFAFFRKRTEAASGLSKTENNPVATRSDSDIVELIRKKEIEVQSQGSGIRSVSLKIRRLVPNAMTIRVPIGTFFVSSSRSAQNMVGTDERTITLANDDWLEISVPAACANRPKDIPGSNDTFSVQRSPQQEELAQLMPLLNRGDVNYATRQAAVWIVTDDASYSDLGILVSRPAFQAFGGRRTIQEAETALAMKICNEAGIDITLKRIWSDRQAILRALGDEDLKKWLEAKH